MTQLLSSATAEASPTWPRRVSLFGAELDAVNMAEALALIMSWIRESEPRCRYVVTPNVDHVVMLQQHAGMKRAYADASLVVADGWPIVAASRWLGQAVPERVSGSDLVPGLFDRANQLAANRPWSQGIHPRQLTNSPIQAIPERFGLADADGDFEAGQLRVYLLGAAPSVAARAARRIHARWNHVRVVGFRSPPLGFERCPEENAAILASVAAAEPDLLIIGLGAPKQELWVHANRTQLRAKVAVCAGATIDFLAGERRRAPAWMRRARLEWLHRLLSEPRRLARRYARGAVVFPRLVWQERNRLRRTTA